MSPARARLLVLLVIAVGVGLRMPALWAGLGMDDFAQRAMMDGSYPVPRAWWDLFAFVHGDAAELRRLQDAGSMPWWAHPQLTIAPLRPLSSALVWVDVRVLGDRVWLSHLHSLGWLAAMFAAAAWTLRHALPVRVAMVALVLLCIDESHAYPTSWLANRNALVASCFAFLAVGAHLRWRRDGVAWGRWASAGALMAALLAGEYGLGAAAYLVAYEGVGRGDGWRVRLRALLPSVVVMVVWASMYRWAGAGATASAVYVDPAMEPLAALRAASTRIPTMTANLVLALPTGELSLTAQGSAFQAWLGGGTVVALLAWSHWARGAEEDHPRWWLLGSLLAIVPALGGFPAARLAVVGELGMAVVLARVLVRALDEVRAREGARRVGWAALGLTVAALHGVVAPWWGQRDQLALQQLHARAQAATATLPLADDAGAGVRVVVLAAGPEPMTLLYPPLIRAYAGLPRPDAWWVLSMVPGEHELLRVSDRALELRPRARPMLRGVLEQLFHRPPIAFAPGHEIVLSGMTVRVLEVDAEGFPTAVRYTFDRSLQDPSLLLVLPTARGYLRYPIGPVGTTVLIAPAPMAP